MEAAVMAKKKGSTKSPDGGARVTTVAVRASEAWKEWVDQLADYKRLTVADVIDQALVKYARDEGFPEAAPKR
jgi:predicted transcriptional regulator